MAQAIAGVKERIRPSVSQNDQMHRAGSSSECAAFHMRE
jgi:hypothetical protein